LTYKKKLIIKNKDQMNEIDLTGIWVSKDKGITIEFDGVNYQLSFYGKKNSGTYKHDPNEVNDKGEKINTVARDGRAAGSRKRTVNTAIRERLKV
jgi:hypothetical protein